MINPAISLLNEQDKYEINENKIFLAAQKMLQFALNNSDIINLSKIDPEKSDGLTFNADIVLCDDSQIHSLNLDFRGYDKPTDVLSFALFADNPNYQFVIDNTVSLGEVIISLETAERQSIENNKTFEEEIYFLLSHGILHLLGFDHFDDESLELMLKFQDQMILRK